MKGGEYLDMNSLVSIWKSIEDFLNNEIKSFAGDTYKYLQINYPEWAQVGKVHFHFAESRKGSQQPFAFLATTPLEFQIKLGCSIYLWEVH